jgi:hypothetical protein
MRKTWYAAALLLGALCTIWLFAACGSTTAPVPKPAPLDEGVHSSDTIVAARAFGVHDARIAKLLVPADPAKLALQKDADVKRGFDAARASYGFRSGDSSAVALRMPATASGVIVAGASKDPRFQIQLTPSAAVETAQAEVRDGIIVYKDGYADTDVIASAGRGAAELLYLLKTEAAPHSYAWKVKLPEGVAKVESRNDGIWFLDGAGDLVVHVPEPYAVDAVGTKRTALLEWDSAAREMRVTLTSDAGLVYPILLDPTFETEVWVELQNPPPSRGHQMIYDDARQRLVMFGGTIPLNETWIWDGLTWRKRSSGRGEAPVPQTTVSAILVQLPQRLTAPLGNQLIRKTAKASGPQSTDASRGMPSENPSCSLALWVVTASRVDRHGCSRMSVGNWLLATSQFRPRCAPIIP